MNYTALETEGGKIAILLFVLVVLIALSAVMHILGKDPAETGKTLLSNAFTGVSTLLLTKLSARKE